MEAASIREKKSHTEVKHCIKIIWRYISVLTKRTNGQNTTLVHILGDTHIYTMYTSVVC